MKNLKTCCGPIEPDPEARSLGPGHSVFRCRTCGALYAGPKPPAVCERLICTRCFRQVTACTCETKSELWPTSHCESPVESIASVAWQKRDDEL